MDRLGKEEVEPFALVIFGGAGDLSRRLLMPSLFHLHLRGELPPASEVIGVGLPRMTTDRYRDTMAAAVKESGIVDFDENEWLTLADRISFISGTFENDETYHSLRRLIEEVGTRCGHNIIYYLAVPSSQMGGIVSNLDRLKLCRGRYNTKVIVEKPFGRDRASAVELNRNLQAGFDESQIYRMDFYLGMEALRNILYLRFANPLFGNLWNSEHIDHVQISVAEDLGIGSRGRFYEETGVVRDMVQNHLLQMMALIAMEPPESPEAGAVRDERVKVFRAIRPIEPADAVRGQYSEGTMRARRVPGYRQEKDVAPDSATPAFFAGKLLMDSPRWEGVPFYLRTGKRMARNLAQIAIRFRQPQPDLSDWGKLSLDGNTLLVTIVPEQVISLQFSVKDPFAENRVLPAEMSLDYRDAFDKPPCPPYETLLTEAMTGDLTFFVRQDAVEAMWDIVDPVIGEWENRPPDDFPNYVAGSWGPVAADELMGRDGRRWLSAAE